MSADLDKLIEQKNKLLSLKEGDDDNKEITDLFHDIDMEFGDAMDVGADIELIYEYLRFCITCLETFGKVSFYNMDYNIVDRWSDVVENDDFPEELESKLLNLVSHDFFEKYYNIKSIADKFVKDEKYEKAITYYSVVKNKINNEDLWDELARCYGRFSNYQAAVETLENAVKVLPNSQLLWVNCGFYWYKCGDNSKALKCFQQAIKIAECTKYAYDQHYIYALKFKASIYRELNMPLQALVEYSRLSTAGNSDSSFLVENSELTLSHIESSSYE